MAPHPRLGVIVRLQADPAETLKRVTELELQTCQVSAWQRELMTDAVADGLKAEAARRGIRISAFWCGYPGTCVWNFLQGPATIGLVPRGIRELRKQALIRGAEFTARAGVADMATHVGFIPEDPADPLYGETIEALGGVVEACRKQKVHFLFETGQETPVAILRCIEDLGEANLGVNLDPANLVLYGKANPVDALDVFGKYVRGIHAKDGKYPVNGRELGKETAIGQGKVDFKGLFAGLKALGYTGAVTIEREIHGPQQTIDIKASFEYLGPLLG
ncbi:MAG: sugar phosphate isomerase/epimerase family protein [Planctomycetota bacterium]